MNEVIESILNEAAKAEAESTVSDALNILKEGALKYPTNDQIQFQIGRLAARAKAWGVALSHYQKISERHDKLPPDVALGMAQCLLGLKRTARAKELFDALDKKAPQQNKEVLVGLAVCSRHLKDLVAAEAYVKKALVLDAGFQPAHHALAEIILDLDAKDKSGQALVALEFNVLREDLYNESLDLWMKFLVDTNRQKYMQDTLESLAKRFPKKVEFIFGFGVACNRAGEITLARPAIQKADALLPDNGKILYELGLVERIAGNVELSKQLIKRSLQLRPDFPAGIRTYGIDHKYSYGDEEFSRLNKLAANLADMPLDDQVQIHYALGKAFDDVVELDASFMHYAIGGVKKRKEENYNEKANIRLFSLLESLITKKLIDKEGSTGCVSDVPVFILGMPRSGTTLMEQILSSHPDIFGAGELKMLMSVFENIDIGGGRRLRMGDIEPAFPYETNAGYADRGQHYIDQIQRLIPEGQSYKRIVDKMPGNFNFVGLIHMILPNAKIIHSRRHPVETCLSCYRIHFSEGQQWSYHLRELGRYYRRYWNLMKHWREVMPGVMLEVRYEDNVADVEGQARKLIEYLDLPWNDNCLNFYDTDRPVKTASATQVRKPIYTTSTNRWRKYEHYLGPLLEEIGDIVEEYEAEIAHLMPKN